MAPPVVQKRKRVTHPPERIKMAVTEARHSGCTAAVSKLNKNVADDERLTVTAVENWLSRFRKEGNFWENEKAKRGRPAVLDKVPGARAEWKRQVESLQRQGEPVSGRASAAVVKAVLEVKAPSVLAEHGGSVKGCSKTGARMMAAEDLTYRKKTSSRILPPESSLQESRDAFYGKLSSCVGEEEVDPALVINFDQTAYLYNPSRGYTWAKRGAKRVQVAESKEGFTLVPVISAAGFIAAQMIFPGTTAVSLPTVDPGAVLQYEQTSSHWSNEATTIKLLKKIVFPHIAARRAATGSHNAPAIVLADAYPPHWTPAVRAVVEEQEAVSYVAVPDSLTHLFQPLDLGVIAAIKQSVLRRKDDFLQKEVEVAVKEGRDVTLSRSRPVLRNKVTTWIKECIMDPSVCSAHCCESGFRRAGVLRVLLGDCAGVDVDSYVSPPVCSECGEPAIPRDDVPVCGCFADGEPRLLCDGCFHNHSTLCDPIN